MPIVVEDGTGLEAANSYASEAELDTYCDDRGIELPDADAEAALVRASDWIDYHFGPRFMGQKLHLRKQGREWPRVGIIDRSGIYVDYSVIPVEIKRATFEAAIREMNEPGSLSPDLDRGNAIKAIKAGPVAIDYGGNASPVTIFSQIEQIIAALIGGDDGSLTVRASRA